MVGEVLRVAVRAAHEHVDGEEGVHAGLDRLGVLGLLVLHHGVRQLDSEGDDVPGLPPLGLELRCLPLSFQHLLAEALELAGALEDLVVVLEAQPEGLHLLVLVVAGHDGVHGLPHDIAQGLLGDTQVHAVEDIDGDEGQREPRNLKQGAHLQALVPLGGKEVDWGDPLSPPRSLL
eukprot:8359473-Alexandrium_andersonii.AAC.1